MVIRQLTEIFFIVKKGGELVYNIYRSRQREKTNNKLEFMMQEALQDLSNKIQPLQEDFRKSKESIKNDFQIIRGHMEKNPGNKEMGIVCVLSSMLDQNIQNLSKNIQTLEEEVNIWSGTTKHDLHLLRADLENQGKKEEEIAKELRLVLIKKHLELSKKLETQEEVLKEWSGTTKRDHQLIKADLENQGKEEQSSRAQQCRIETLLDQLSQRFQTVEQILQSQQELLYHEFQLFRAYLVNNQDFFRSVSGGEVERITPGASDNLHVNQDQRTTCLDSLFRNIEGIQRSLDIRANDLQVLTLWCLISIIILKILDQIFTLPWP